MSLRNILNEDIKYDILIRAKPEDVEHKMQDVIHKHNSKLKDGEDNPDWQPEACYWTVSKPPVRKGIFEVLFTDGKNVFAKGDYIGNTIDSIEFMSLERVSYPQPKPAPTRGFTYVEIDELGRFVKC